MIELILSRGIFGSRSAVNSPSCSCAVSVSLGISKTRNNRAAGKDGGQLLELIGEVLDIGRDRVGEILPASRENTSVLTDNDWLTCVRMAFRVHGRQPWW